MDTNLFRKEDSKYSGLWQNGYKDANWHKLANYALNVANSIDGKVTMVDFGFGKGTAMDFFISNGIDIQGVEISDYAVQTQLSKGKKVYHSSLDNMSMFKNNQFRIGFCNDVIEHVPENLIMPTLREMARVCSDYLLISVCPTPSHHLSLEGENLHLTVKPKEWWEDKSDNYGDVKRVKFFLSRSLRYEIDLKNTI
jgi:ubiquinone/menaquinone biosynthesis C-methylase UbiE